MARHRLPPAEHAARRVVRRYGGYFTQDDIRELVDYAARRHINIMPELDMPGHSLALCTAYPATLPNKFPGSQSPQGTVGNVLSPAKESNYAMIDDILGELATIFPFDYIHIGGDEVNHDIWSQDPEIKGFMAREKIASLHDAQVYFTARLEKILARRHKRMIGWNEILNDKLQRTTGIMSWTGIGPGYQARAVGLSRGHGPRATQLLRHGLSGRGRRAGRPGLGRRGRRAEVLCLRSPGRQEPFTPAGGAHFRRARLLVVGDDFPL